MLNYKPNFWFIHKKVVYLVILWNCTIGLWLEKTYVWNCQQPRYFGMPIKPVHFLWKGAFLLDSCRTFYRQIFIRALLYSYNMSLVELHMIRRQSLIQFNMWYTTKHFIRTILLFKFTANFSELRGITRIIKVNFSVISRFAFQTL